MRSMAEKETLMAEYTGPVCALCAVRACSSEPGIQEPPTLCPMLAEAEVLEEVERAYIGAGRSAQAGSGIGPHGGSRILPCDAC